MIKTLELFHTCANSIVCLQWLKVACEHLLQCLVFQQYFSKQETVSYILSNIHPMIQPATNAKTLHWCQLNEWAAYFPDVKLWKLCVPVNRLRMSATCCRTSSDKTTSCLSLSNVTKKFIILITAHISELADKSPWQILQSTCIFTKFEEERTTVKTLSLFSSDFKNINKYKAFYLSFGKTPLQSATRNTNTF